MTYQIRITQQVEKILYFYVDAETGDEARKKLAADFVSYKPTLECVDLEYEEVQPLTFTVGPAIPEVI